MRAPRPSQSVCRPVHRLRTPLPACACESVCLPSSWAQANCTVCQWAVGSESHETPLGPPAPTSSSAIAHRLHPGRSSVHLIFLVRHVRQPVRVRRFLPSLPVVLCDAALCTASCSSPPLMLPSYVEARVGRMYADSSLKGTYPTEGAGVAGDRKE